MTKRIEITYDRNFDTLLFDSIEMLFHSLDPEIYYDFRQTLGRSCMLNSILLLELSGIEKRGQYTNFFTVLIFAAGGLRR